MQLKKIRDIIFIIGILIGVIILVRIFLGQNTMIYDEFLNFILFIIMNTLLIISLHLNKTIRKRRTIE